MSVRYPTVTTPCPNMTQSALFANVPPVVRVVLAQTALRTMVVLVAVLSCLSIKPMDRVAEYVVFVTSMIYLCVHVL